jgi:hypothetical protein
MSTNLITVVADGIEAYESYVSILREQVDELAANGMEYEEQDRRAEPVTTTLLVSIAAAALSTTLTEIIKVIIKRICDRAEKEVNPPAIQININTNNYLLPQDRAIIISRIDSLTGR